MCVHVRLHEAVTVEKGVGVLALRVRHRRERGGNEGCGWACVDHRRQPWLCERVYGRRAVGKGVGALLLHVSPDANRSCREQGTRAGSEPVRVGGSCGRGQGMTSALCELSWGKGTGVAALHECACELLRVLGSPGAGEGAAVGSRVGALALVVCRALLQGAAREGSVSGMRPGEILGLYVKSLQRPPSTQGHGDPSAALFPTTAASGFHQAGCERIREML